MEWISVKEKLPDNDRDVLISDGAIVLEGFYDELEGKWLIWMPDNSISLVRAADIWPDRENPITYWSDDYSLPYEK